MSILLSLIAATSASLLVGAIWAYFLGMPRRLEGFLIALAGGALLIAAVLELIQPAISQQTWLPPLAAFFVGGLFYTGLIQMLDRAGWIPMAEGSAGKILLAGVPQNLAIGLALIGSSAVQIAALIGSIVISNLPWSANATRGMTESGHSGLRVASSWAGVILLLAMSLFLGRYGLKAMPDALLHYLRCFAAGAIICALTVDVFPQAFYTDERLSGLATIIGVIIALSLNQAL